MDEGAVRPRRDASADGREAVGKSRGCQSKNQATALRSATTGAILRVSSPITRNIAPVDQSEPLVRRTSGSGLARRREGLSEPSEQRMRCTDAGDAQHRIRHAQRGEQLGELGRLRVI